jgi:hypothetical protein
MGKGEGVLGKGKIAPLSPRVSGLATGLKVSNGALGRSAASVASSVGGDRGGSWIDGCTSSMGTYLTLRGRIRLRST